MPKSLIFVPALAMLGSTGLAQKAPPQAPKPVTKADYVKNIDSRFGNIDTNHDGFLTPPELEAAETKIAQQLTAARQQRLQAEFKQLDTNKDGQLSLQEFMAAAPPIKARETPQQIVQQLDANKDGKISAEEFRNSQMAPFNKLDTNHDGVVSVEEMRKGSQQ